MPMTFRSFLPPLSWALQVIAIAAFFGLAAFYSGLTNEVFSRLSPPAQQPPIHRVEPHAVELPKSPFFEAGRRPDGSFDPWLLELRLRAVGFNQAAAVSLVPRLLPLSTTLVGVSDPALEQTLVREAQEVVDEMRQAYPRQHAALEHPETIALRPDGAAWLDFQAALLMQGFTSQPQFAAPQNPAGMHKAMRVLFAAVDRAGLRVLHVAPANLSSPQRVQELAARIDDANHALQQATGWEGGVLGLDGRVELTVGMPLQSADDGFTYSSRKSDRLIMIARHRSLAHEWLHALDFTLGKLVVQHPSHNTLSSQVAPLRQMRHPQLARDWELARQRLEDAAPHWAHARSRQGIVTQNPYWLSHAEEMAFAFQAYVARQSPMLALPHALERYNALYPYAYPTPAELDAQRPAWPVLFSKLRRLQLVKDTP